MTTKIEVLEKLGATITAVTVSYDRKVSDGDYGSISGFFSMTTELESDANAEQVASALFEIVRESAEANLAPAFKAVAGTSRFPANKPAMDTSQDATFPPDHSDLADGQDAIPAHDGSVKSIRFTVEGHDGGKVKLSFFAEGRKWADITRVCTVDTAISMMQPTAKNGKQWTQNHFEPGKDYALGCTVYYALSDKKNSKGNPYKDIVAVR